MANTPPSRSTRIAAWLAIALLLVLSALLVVRASEKPGDLNAFLPMYATAAFIFDVLTAYLLSIQFLNSRQLSIGFLAGAYSFNAPITLIQLCVFPGVFNPTGLFSGGPQAAIWLWATWHAAFPTWILFAMICEAVPAARLMSRRAFHYFSRPILILPPIIAVVLSARILKVGPDLQPLIEAGHYDLLQHHPIGIYAIAASALAFMAVLVLGRWKSLLWVWLSVAMLCALLDVSLTLVGGARYSVGWYASRALSVATAGSLLAITLWEINQLYARLSHSNRRLADLASHDGLTGTRNRRHFDAALSDEMAKARQGHTALSLLICDVDYFKRFNDTQGHVRGDEVLVAVARTLDLQSRRGVDVVARYGGEEFAIILPGITARSARVIAERMRQSIFDLQIEAPPGGHPCLSISVGVAVFDADHDDPQHFIERADEALYRAKANGRNRVEVAEMIALHAEARVA
jgi:diguanylate cyclase (GGDEF)-like protein